MNSSVIVMAKSPQPGRVKTRLCPPCSPHDAAEIATAALAATLQAVAGTRSARRVIALEGPAEDWFPRSFDIVEQRGTGLAQRLAAAFEDVGGPAIAIGMDSPQISPALIELALESLGGADAALGPTSDGGYWGIALRRPDSKVFDGVPMSEPTTYGAQRRRLQALGLSCRELPGLHDVDHFADALQVAELIPGTEFAAVVRAVSLRLEAAL